MQGRRLTSLRSEPKRGTVSLRASSQMAGPARADTLAFAFFSERPRALLYVSVESGNAPGVITKHYFSFGTQRASHPKLFLLYPTDTAPADTPHLCVLLDSKKSLHKLVDSLPHYTAAKPGGSTRVSRAPYNEAPLRNFLKQHRANYATQLPEPCDDETLEVLMDEKYEFPHIFKVGYLPYYLQSADCMCRYIDAHHSRYSVQASQSRTLGTVSYMYLMYGIAAEYVLPRAF